MDIVFVILHYMSISETVRCVNYIKNNIDTADYHILIIDNASENGSGKDLKMQYENEPKCSVILNDKNMGFARGNNVGFRYAKEYFMPEYIILLNNDVYLLEKNLYEKLNREYQKSGFFVLGPMILTGDGRCDVNPVRTRYQDIKDIDKMILSFKKVLRRYQYHYARAFYWMMAIINSIVFPRRKKEKKEYLSRREDVQLHGCFMAFSKSYYEVYDGLDETTFLYCEEDFLYKHMKENSHKTVYDPSILVYHEEDAATDMVVKSDRDKMIFFCKNNLASLEGLKKVYEYYNKRGEQDGK